MCTYYDAVLKNTYIFCVGLSALWVDLSKKKETVANCCSNIIDKLLVISLLVRICVHITVYNTYSLNGFYHTKFRFHTPLIAICIVFFSMNIKKRRHLHFLLTILLHTKVSKVSSIWDMFLYISMSQKIPIFFKNGKYVPWSPGTFVHWFASCPYGRNM